MRSFAFDGGAKIDLWERWLPAPDSRALFQALLVEVPWASKSIRIAGREVVQPRLTAWYGDREAVYTYSGLRNVPLPWNASLRALRARLESELALPFNGALLNYYRDGRDSMGFHADDEPELGRCPVVPSISLGATRRFALRHVKNGGERLDLDLEDGSLLVMSGTTQHDFRHALPKQAGKGPRINITFRMVQSVEERGVAAEGSGLDEHQERRPTKTSRKMV